MLESHNQEPLGSCEPRCGSHRSLFAECVGKARRMPRHECRSHLGQLLVRCRRATGDETLCAAALQLPAVCLVVFAGDDHAAGAQLPRGRTDEGQTADDAATGPLATSRGAFTRVERHRRRHASH
jgi:hypothetical protein